jgi:5-hydroxyisourate hydrolase-like protein (transthyretin family)
MRFLFRATALLAGLSTIALAGPPMAKITIHVAAATSGKPIERASVVIRLEKGRSPARLYKKMVTNWETRTNQEGDVTLPAIPQGRIRVQVIAKGFQTYGDFSEVDADTKTIDIKLNPPQPQYTVK